MPQDLAFDEEVFFSYASDDLVHVRQLARRLWDEYTRIGSESWNVFVPDPSELPRVPVGAPVPERSG